MTAVRLCLAFLLVVAGCAAPAGIEPSDGGTSPEATPVPQASPAARPDPPTDRLGWEDGYWYDDPLDVNRADGLNASERRAFVARTMARVERIRQLEFERSVPVEVRSRAAVRNDSHAPSASAWNEQVWEALFLVGEDRTVAEAFDALYGESVLGYYSPAEGRIVVVGDAETPAIDRQTLAHELVHALQDQQFAYPNASTHDASLAARSVVEGDATYVQHRYAERCRTEWDCLPRPNRTRAGPPGNMGVYVAVYFPYSDGPRLVHGLRRRGGWEAVNDAYARPPASTAQVVHPERYPDSTPVHVAVADRSNATWHRVGDGAGDTLGEASLYATLWRTGRIDSTQFYRTGDPHRGFNYTHPLTTGWAGDAIVPYRSDEGYGYVFRSEWETAADARAFAGAYRSILRDRYDAAEPTAGVYVVEAGPFADAFRVTREGTTVTVVNAPTVAALDGVHRRED